LLPSLGRAVRGSAHEALEALARLPRNAEPVVAAGLGDRIEVAAGTECTLDPGRQSFKRADRTQPFGRFDWHETHSTASLGAGQDVKRERFAP
jgi:hypothetical protein